MASKKRSSGAAATPTTDVTLYVFRRPPSLAKSDGSARLHAERLTMRKARGTVFHDALGEKAEEARLVAVMEAITRTPCRSRTR